MLKSLTIKNYAIIDNLTIDFDGGFNAFVGETGAGKSIIVGALSYLLKGRSDTSVIKSGRDKAIVEGIFDIQDPSILNKLKEQDIDVDGDIIVKRAISAENKSSIKINESNVTLSFLEDLFSNYVDIHSQKDNHFLFQKKNQLLLLDRYAKDEELLDQYQNAYNAYLFLNKQLEELKNNTYNESEIEYYKFDYKELDEAEISIDEEEDLEAKEKRYKESEKYLTTLSNAINLYDQNYGVKENLYDLFNGLNLDDPEVIQIQSKIKDAYYEIDENIDQLKNILSSFTDSDLDINYIEDRLFLYSKLKRKHKTDIEGLLNKKNELQEKIKFFEDKDFVLNEKEKEVTVAKQKAYKLAQELHETRIHAAKELIHSVLENTQDLLLNNCVFKIGFNNVEMNMSGIDDVEYMVSMNKGEEIKPLRNVASGGEISRLMLALKAVFAKLSNCEVLIFDEIDTGVSGKVANAIGKKISELSKDAQVFCITHLSPVAACGDHFYKIYKDDMNGQTQTNVKEVFGDEFIQELAMISNNSIDQKAMDAAEELFENSQKMIHEN